MTESRPETLLWIRHPPYSTVHLAEAVRLAAMGTALDEAYRVLFLAEGVRTLVRHQEPFLLGPPIESILAGIVTEERPGLVHLPSLLRRGLDRSSLVDRIPLRLVDDEEAAATLGRAGRVVPF